MPDPPVQLTSPAFFLNHPSSALYCSSYRQPSLPVMKARPSAEATTLDMETPSVGMVKSVAYRVMSLAVRDRPRRTSVLEVQMTSRCVIESMKTPDGRARSRRGLKQRGSEDDCTDQTWP